ncbi:MAG: MarR family winged helix-turn-helix transcriptional regulator [Gaiellaceae bacterium]
MSPPPEDLDFFLTLTLAAAKAWPLITREFDAAGVEPGNWGLLFHVGARENVTPSELAAETGVTPTTMRDQIQTQVDRGLLERVPNPLDARSYYVALTARGQHNLDEGLKASRRAAQLLQEELGDLEPLRQSLIDLTLVLATVNERALREERARRVEAVRARRSRR